MANLRHRVSAVGQAGEKKVGVAFLIMKQFVIVKAENVDTLQRIEIARHK